MQGFRILKGGSEVTNRVRVEKIDSRCGCEARIRVHVDKLSGMWLVTTFTDQHTHEMVDSMHCGMLPAHRHLTTGDILQINEMRNAGLSNPLIYSAIASQSGGYYQVPFRKKDIDNQIGKQRLVHPSDASGALRYLESLVAHDPMMFISHTVDKEKCLEHIFWCDGTSRVNYELFGDVVGFDATYRKNKYEIPVVIFSGVNHHNMTTIFAVALIANETEETYTWLLNTFYTAMKGKAPMSVITDGCMSMRNAIKSVFPNAHHRLCAWHLIRNVVDNVKIPAFVTEFKTCMLVDMEVAEFQRRWMDAVTKFDLGQNKWVNETYEKRNQWAACLVRGSFFGGIRTTSRCEALHSKLLKFVHSRVNLADFAKQFQRYLNFMRHKEVEAYFENSRGKEPIQTCLRGIEMSASTQFTREIMAMLCRVFVKLLLMRVSVCSNMSNYLIFTVNRYPKRNREWLVSFYQKNTIFKCACQRMESYGLPCEHIIAVMVELNIDDFPKSLILPRWTKSAKDLVCGKYTDGSQYWNSHVMTCYSDLLELCRQLCNFGSKNEVDIKHISN